MRIEGAGARTWLLAAVALWAACTWALAAFGLGERVRPLPEDPALLQPLPQGEAVAAERLGPLPRYADIRDRAIFAPDRRHRPFFLEVQEEGSGQVDDFDVVLTSVLITPQLEMAIVQPREGEGEALRFRLGESVRQAPGWTLTSLSPRSATFAGPEGERVLELRVFDGIGGEPPTRVAAASAAEAGAQEPARQARRRASGDASGQEGMPVPVAQGEGRPGPEASRPGTNAADAGDASDDGTRAAQAEAIRRRIEERRARLREQQ